MVEMVRPARGGFVRPFGRGWFIREFLMGNSPYGSPSIDPDIGAPQADIFHYYKMALIRGTALNRATRAEQKQARWQRRPINPDNIDRLAERYQTRTSYRAHGCRCRSFITYFANLQGLGWVEPTGLIETSAFQEQYPPDQPRRYYRLTPAGLHAGEEAWINPYLALYGHRLRGNSDFKISSEENSLRSP